MPAGFASIEARINRATHSHLANAYLSIGGGSACDGIFDRAFLEAGDGFGMASSTPMVALQSALVPASPVGMQLVITQGQGIGTWRIAAAEPDGTGITQLALERAS